MGFFFNQGHDFKWMDDRWKEWFLVVGFGLSAYAANYSSNLAAQNLEAGLSSMIRSSDTVFAYIWGVILFSQNPTWMSIVGAVLMMSAVVIVSWYKYLKILKQKSVSQFCFLFLVSYFLSEQLEEKLKRKIRRGTRAFRKFSAMSNGTISSFQ